jgi:hypothetical protein
VVPVGNNDGPGAEHKSGNVYGDDGHICQLDTERCISEYDILLPRGCAEQRRDHLWLDFELYNIQQRSGTDGNDGLSFVDHEQQRNPGRYSESQRE